MRPLVRWTVGPVSRDGFNVLRESIRLFCRLYEDADKVVCFNNLDKAILRSKLRNLPVRLFEVRHDPSEIEYKPRNEIWKLYPPRMEINTHELVLDNDLIIMDKMGDIDDFFNGDHTILLQGRNRYYGQYNHMVKEGYKINGGLFGMPPEFDFSESIRNICKDDKERRWQNRSDDQGIIATALLSYKNFHVVPNAVLVNYDDNFDTKDPSGVVTDEIKGVHFIGVNRHRHPGWEYYQRRITLL